MTVEVCRQCRGQGARMSLDEHGSERPQRVIDIDEWATRKWYRDRGYADTSIAPCPLCWGEGVTKAKEVSNR